MIHLLKGSAFKQRLKELGNENYIAQTHIKVKKQKQKKKKKNVNTQKESNIDGHIKFK